VSWVPHLWIETTENDSGSKFDELDTKLRDLVMHQGVTYALLFVVRPWASKDDRCIYGYRIPPQNSTRVRTKFCANDWSTVGTHKLGTNNFPIFNV
jgi:hypothetical protein